MYICEVYNRDFSRRLLCLRRLSPSCLSVLLCNLSVMCLLLLLTINQVYISELNGATKVKSNEQVAMNKNSDPVLGMIWNHDLKSNLWIVILISNHFPLISDFDFYFKSIFCTILTILIAKENQNHFTIQLPFLQQYSTCYHISDDYGYNEDTAPSQSTGDGAAVNNLKLQAINYLTEANTSLSSLQSYPAVQTVFVRYNTSLTSFVAVERLFSCAELIATSRRNRLSDSTFEKLFMLKANHYEPQW